MRCSCGYARTPTPTAPAAPKSRTKFQLPGCFVQLLLLGSLGLVVYGCDEYRVGRGAAAEPVPVDLADLEAGKLPTQNHVRIGRHVPIYDRAICSLFKSQKDSPDPLLVSTLYPIVSPGKIAGWDGKVTVLVETRRFKQMSKIPKHNGGVEDSIDGMLVNSIRSLGTDEARLIREGLPDQDTEKILIVEENRRPTEASRAFWIMGGGIGLGLLTMLGWLLASREEVE